ncbi:MAG: heavy metal-responsive transcriptional regulator [Armatimonadetes bacterium]|nr:heavy metal-responsive transcriptional regulator [Armatimonadota bacterium]
MRIGELAAKARVNPKTIRYYEDIGLLPAPPRTSTGYRQYADSDVERLEFILSAHSLGLALAEIKEILAFRDRGTYPCPYVLALIDTKVREIEARIEGLRRLTNDLKRLRKAAAAIPQEEIAAKARFCHIIENQQLLKLRERPLASSKRMPKTAL